MTKRVREPWRSHPDPEVFDSFLEELDRIRSASKQYPIYVCGKFDALLEGAVVDVKRIKGGCPESQLESSVAFLQSLTLVSDNFVTFLHLIEWLKTEKGLPMELIDEVTHVAFATGMNFTAVEGNVVIGYLKNDAGSKWRERENKRSAQSKRAEARGLPSDEQITEIASEVIRAHQQKTGSQISLKSLKSKTKAKIAAKRLTLPGEWKLKQTVNSALISAVCSAKLDVKSGAQVERPK